MHLYVFGVRGMPVRSSDRGRPLTSRLTSPVVPVSPWRMLRTVLEPLLDRFVS